MLCRNPGCECKGGTAAYQPPPEPIPYPYADRLPTLLDRYGHKVHEAALEAYRDRTGKEPPEVLKVGSLDSGSFREVFAICTPTGEETGLVLKVDLNPPGYGFGCEEEVDIIDHVSKTAPDLLRLFPKVYAWGESEVRLPSPDIEGEEFYDDRVWLLCERVSAGRRGAQWTGDLAAVLYEQTGVEVEDDHAGNIGRRESTGETVFLDWGHFEIA